MAKVQGKTSKGQEAKQKDKYRVTNWGSYNQSLINRGSITIWFDEAMLKGWYYEGPEQRGAQYKYSDACIMGLLQLKAVFGLKYRQLQGFAASLVDLMGLDLEVPSYSQIDRRAQQVKVDIAAPQAKGPVFLVFDSTGLKVFGEGEWKVRKHGYSKRRTWRKLHLGVDESTGFIHAQVLTENGKGDGDAQQLPGLLDQVKSPVDRAGGDGAYDTYEVWELLEKKNIQGIIPPQENAIYWEDEKGQLLALERNKILEQIDMKGRKEWKQESRYHRRSLAETAMFRFKTIFGPELYSRKLKSQQAEAAVKILCLNKMTGIGMPISVKVA